MIKPEIYPGLIFPEAKKLKEIICDVFEVSEFIVPGRMQPESVARMVYACLLKELAGMSYTDIGNTIGRTRANVYNAIMRVNDTYRNDAKYGKLVLECEERAKNMFDE